MKEKNWYKCYSYRLFDFLRTNGIQSISTGYNEHTERRFWVYSMNDELSTLLKAYSNYKHNN